MLEYNNLVEDAFMHPQFVLPSNISLDSLKQSQAGARPHGVWFALYYDPIARKLYYKVYGSPYAIAAVETLARLVAEGGLSLGQAFDAESLRQQLNMPYPYMNVLINLEDAWLALSEE